MLTPSFKTATELGIQQNLYDALRKVLDLLETDKIPGLPDNASDYSGSYKDWDANDYSGLFFFDMMFEHQPYDCGAAGCLLGWARHVSGETLITYREIQGKVDNYPLYCLFYPQGESLSCRDPKTAALVLRTFLETGKVIWSDLYPKGEENV